MTETVQRSARSGARALIGYGTLSLAIGLCAFAVFLWAAFATGNAAAARLALLTGAVVQWAVFAGLFPGVRRTVAADAARGIDQEKVATMFVAAAIAEAGWIMLLVATFVAVFATDIMMPLGLAAEVWLIIALVAFMVPATLVILAVLFALMGARNAR